MEDKQSNKATSTGQSNSLSINWYVGLLTGAIISLLFLIITYWYNKQIQYSAFFAIPVFAFLLCAVEFVNTMKSLITVIIVGLAIITGSVVIEMAFFSMKSYVLESEYVHLGDATVDFMKPAAPYGVLASYNFTLSAIPLKIQARVRLKDIDSDIRKGPAFLYINRMEITDLNKYFSDVAPSDEHTAPWREITIKDIPIGYLKTGKNTVMIAVRPIDYNYDDINFTDLRVLFR